MAKETNPTISPVFFVIFIILISLSYSFGYCLLSRSLCIKSRENVLGCLNRNYALLLGICIVLLANALYMFMLRYAPVPMLAGIFSSVLVSVLACSFYFLKDEIPFLACFGYGSIILAEAVVFAIFLQEPIYQLPRYRSSSMEINAYYGITYCVVLLSILVGGCCFAYWFEKHHGLNINNNGKLSRCLSPAHMQTNNRQYLCQSPADAHIQQTLANLIEEDFDQPNNDSVSDQNETHSFSIFEDDFEQSSIPDDQQNKVFGIFRKNINHPGVDTRPIAFLIAQIIYPTCLGIIEALFVFQLNQNKNLALNILFSIVLSFGMIIFFILVYSRFAISGVFPIEFSVLTFACVLGGSLFSGEENTLKVGGFWIYICIGGIVLFGGIVLIALATWRKNQNGCAVETSKTSSDPLVSMLSKLPPEGRNQALSPPMPSPFCASEDEGTRVAVRKKHSIKSSSDPLVSIMMKLRPEGSQQTLTNEKYDSDDSLQIPSPL
mmetsp:Transcript_9591/g.14052  ORF Transcript_9591/g.14052 Transcript_9591/m.14052 type:complete len:492 (+) Transcript_9591:210-1685(+)